MGTLLQDSWGTWIIGPIEKVKFKISADLFTFLVRDLYWDGVAGLLGDVVTDRDRDLLAVLLRNLHTQTYQDSNISITCVEAFHTNGAR